MSSKTVESILLHMNKDHRTSLYDYLAVYGGIKLDLDDPKQSVELVDVRLDKLTLNYSRAGALKSTVVPLDPPMKNLGEARNRLIAMAFESADALGVSPYRVTKFVRPSRARTAFGVTLGALVLAIGGATVSPSFAARTVGLGTRLHRTTRLTFYGTIVVHLVELVHSLQPLLRYYRVPARLRLYYYILTSLVGFPAWLALKEKAAELNEHRAQFEKRISSSK